MGLSAAPAFSLLSCPPSPKGKDIPRPPSPVGKGEIKVIFMQGAPPLASPGLNPDGTGQGSAPRTRRGAGFSGCRIDLAAVVPKGGLAVGGAALPCL